METHGDFFADKAMDLANAVAAALIFGQLVNRQMVWSAVFIGLCFFFICVVLSFLLRKKGGK